MCLNQEYSQTLFPQLHIIGGEDIILEQATVTIANSTAEDSLSYDSNGSLIYGDYDATPGTLTLTGPATAKSFETLLRTAHYANSNNATTSIEKSITLTVNFNEQTSNTVNSQINIITANDTPKVVHPIEPFSVMADSEFSQLLSYPFDLPENQLTTSVFGPASTYFNSANNTLSGSLTDVGVNRFSFFGTDRCNQTGVNYFEINVTESTPIPTPTPTGGNTPAIIGGVIGGIAGLLCLGGLVFGGLWARKKKQPQEEANQPDIEMETTAANNPV